MNLKKGILYIILGYIFVFINLYMNFSGIMIDLLPNFIGWIFLLLAYNKLGYYVKDKKYLHFFPLIFLFIGLICDILIFFFFDFYASIIALIFGLISLKYWNNIFNVISTIVDDKKIGKVNSIKTIKKLNIAICIVSILISVVDLFIPLLYTKYVVL